MTTKLVAYLAAETAHGSWLCTPSWMVHVPQLGRGWPHRTSIVVQHEDTCVHTAAVSCHSASSIVPPTSFVAGCVYGGGGGGREEGGGRRGEGGEARGRGEGGEEGVLFHMAIKHPYKPSFISRPPLVSFPVWHTSCQGSGNETKPPPLFVICSSVWHSQYHFTFDVMRFISKML